MIIHVAATVALTSEAYAEYAAYNFAEKTKLPYVSFSRYTPLSALAQALELTNQECMAMIRTDKEIHALVDSAGDAFLHPDMFVRILKKVFQSRVEAILSRA